MKPFRKTVTKAGRKFKVRTWSIRYQDANGKRKEEHGFLTEEEGWGRLRQAKKEVADERLGIRDPQAWNSQKPLREHLADFEKSLKDDGVSAGQVKLVTSRVGRILAGCGFNFPGDLDELRLKSYLAQIRKQGLSEQTLMHYLRAIKQFARFLARHKRVRENPFDGLKVKKEVEKRHARRALSVDEQARLLKAARVRGPLRGISGPDREMLYRTAIQTGLRASELASLIVADLSFDETGMSVTLGGSRTKNGKEAKLPISQILAQHLGHWVADKPRDAVLWPGNWARHKAAGVMLQADLAAAGIPYEVGGDTPTSTPCERLS